jgi:putative transposase
VFFLTIRCVLLTYRYRVKSRLGELNRQARAVNFVWNFCNDTQKHAIKWGKRWPSAYDLQKLCAGTSKELGLSASTIDKVCAGYHQSRRKINRPFLRYRGKRSLGWIPVRAEALSVKDDGFRFNGATYRVFKSREIPAGAKVLDGSSFSQDARGNWFLNVVIEVADTAAREPLRAVGVDLGLKDLAVLSTGERIGNPTHYRRLEAKIAAAQRARKRRQAKAAHARVANARRDHLHKAALGIVLRFDYIAVGNVNAAGLARTSMAKSVNDAGWSSFREMLRYKAIARGAWYEEVNERWSTQTCNVCGVIAGPEGRAGLNERTWTCVCGTTHDRDVNAALNILARRSGHRAPVEGISAHFG